MTATRWLVTGAEGQLGSDVVAVLRTYNEILVACDHPTLDVTSPYAVRSVLDDARPDVVVHCASANADGAGLVAMWCRSAGARLIYVSCVDVFDGETDVAYGEDSPTAPLTAYGETKVAEERTVIASGADAYVIRTSWLYGAVGENEVKALIRRARANDDPVRVVDDTIGTPTWSLHLARALVGLGASDARPGVYHCANDGEASWYVFARAVLAELGLDPARVEPISAAIPTYSVLDTRKWHAAELPRMAHWRDALHEAFVAVGEELTETGDA